MTILRLGIILQSGARRNFEDDYPNEETALEIAEAVFEAMDSQAKTILISIGKRSSCIARQSIEMITADLTIGALE